MRDSAVLLLFWASKVNLGGCQQIIYGHQTRPSEVYQVSDCLLLL